MHRLNTLAFKGWWHSREHLLFISKCFSLYIGRMLLVLLHYTQLRSSYWDKWGDRPLRKIHCGIIRANSHTSVPPPSIISVEGMCTKTYYYLLASYSWGHNISNTYDLFFSAKGGKNKMSKTKRQCHSYVEIFLVLMGELRVSLSQRVSQKLLYLEHSKGYYEVFQEFWCLL